jgi:hypothetical protein
MLTPDPLLPVRFLHTGLSARPLSANWNSTELPLANSPYRPGAPVQDCGNQANIRELTGYLISSRNQTFAVSCNTAATRCAIQDCSLAHRRHHACQPTFIPVDTNDANLCAPRTLSVTNNRRAFMDTYKYADALMMNKNGICMSYLPQDFNSYRVKE